jgi:hypothetical protein
MISIFYQVRMFEGNIYLRIQMLFFFLSGGSGEMRRHSRNWRACALLWGRMRINQPN